MIKYQNYDNDLTNAGITAQEDREALIDYLCTLAKIGIEAIGNKNNEDNGIEYESENLYSMDKGIN